MRDDADNLEIGSTIANGLRVRERLGSGGMGTVWRVHDQALQRDVALKLVHSELAKDHQIRTHFLEEARAMARVRHPGVVEIYSFGTLEERPYFTMECVDGRSLEQEQKRRGAAFPASSAIAALCELASGLEAIHASGTVHGDLTPRNILVRRNGSLSITDFGLTVDGIDGKARFLGTARYAAPEKIRAHVPPHLRTRSDVYSLGTVGYQMLTGDTPFNGPDATRVFAQHLYKKPKPLAEVAPGTPRELCDAIDATLRKAPDERPTSAALVDLLSDAKQALSANRQALIVDDDPDFQAIAAASLETVAGFSSVQTASCGEDALDILARQRFDLLVLDFHMPGTDVVSLTEKIRKDRSHDGMQILIVTGRGSASDWHRLSEVGANAFHFKPIVPTEFGIAARKLIENPR